MNCQDEVIDKSPYEDYGPVRLLLQPDDGVAPLLRAIARAKSSIDLLVFRFDQKEIERALTEAVARGVSVRALVAHTNRAGEESLRRLEVRLLAAGVTVARTGDAFARYHGKLMVIDRRELYLMAFNLTSIDMDHSRSFAVVTRSGSLVREAVRLLDADAARQPYEPGVDRFLVSPANARRQLTRFLKGAKKELLIYDPKISDPTLLRLLEERRKAGVKIQVLGHVDAKRSILSMRKMTRMRLHARAIVRDGTHAFLGSQSLRAMELDERREVGLIFRDPKVVSRLARFFHSDWELANRHGGPSLAQRVPTGKLAKKVAKAVAKDLPPLKAILNGAVKDLADAHAAPELDIKQVEQTVKDAVKEVVRDAVEQAVERNGGKER